MADADFKFPDEIDGITIDREGDNFEIEIEDDTPEEDRGRTPSDPEKVKKLEIEVDDLDKYSKEAKDKLIRMKRVWNDERRAKEAAERERQEAIVAARTLYAKNKRLEEMLTKGEGDYKEAQITAAQAKLKAAKKALKSAHEAGDSDALAEASVEIGKYQAELDKAENFKLPPLQEDNFVVQPPQQAQSVPKPDARVLEWQDDNPWYGQDPEMTAAALGLHEKMKKEGVRVGSEEYYERLDKTMRKRFSDYFEEEAPEEKPKAPAKTKAGTVVAPATRSTAPKKVRLSQSQVALAKKLGITPEQYVREMLKMEA